MRIKVITLNLWFGGELFDGVLDFLKQQDADVVLLQEVYNGEDPALKRQFRSMQVLKAELSYPYQDFIADYRDFDRTDGKAQRGNAILSRFPLVSHPPIFFGSPYSETYRDILGHYSQDCPRDVQHVVLGTPAGEVNVFNIHGAWDLDGDNYGEQRQAMSEAVIGAIKGRPNVILAGDTNAKPTNRAIIEIEEYLKSVFGKAELVSTFNMRRKDNPGYATAAVDMILVSPYIKVVTRDCPDIDISDHLPLVATLELG
jgi:endonuclease/exonuclease/phosphatase family metal-dependent hydrolase